MARGRAIHSVARVLDDVFAAAWAASQDEEIAAEATRRALVAAPAGSAEGLAACLAAGRIEPYATVAAHDRDALVLARVLGWKTDRIARQLGTTPADVRARLGRGLRTLLPQRDCVGAASPGCAARAS